MAQLTTTALRNPVFQAKVRNAMREALEMAKDSRSGHGKAYVPNRRGRFILRVDAFTDGRFRVWGDLSVDVTTRVLGVVSPIDGIGGA